MPEFTEIVGAIATLGVLFALSGISAAGRVNYPEPVPRRPHRPNASLLITKVEVTWVEVTE